MDFKACDHRRRLRKGACHFWRFDFAAFFRVREHYDTRMAELKTTRKAERNLKKARIERPVVARKETSSDQQQLSKSNQDTELSPKFELPVSFVVVAGSYEKLLYGLDGTVTSSESGYEFHLKPIFIFPAHVSSIKAVAASPNGGKWLATGSSDEIVKVWDLARRKEIGGLMHHQGMCSFGRRRKQVTVTVLRIHHVSPISVTFSSSLRIRGWYTVSFPCAGLDCPTFAKGTQRPS